jgi:hypothetical protein
MAGAIITGTAARISGQPGTVPGHTALSDQPLNDHPNFKVPILQKAAVLNPRPLLCGGQARIFAAAAPKARGNNTHLRRKK